MIGKQNIGRGFRGTLDYVLEKDQAELIGGNMLGENPQELTTEFVESRKLRPNLDRVVYHTSLSAAPKEHLSDERWNQVAGKYLDAMGFQGCQYVVVRHKDTEIDHVHIVASRIPIEGPNRGKTVSDSQNYQRSEGALRGIEKEYGLQRVTPSREVERRAPTRGELEMAAKGIASTKIQLQGLIDSAILDKPHISQFIERMKTAGVGVIPNIAKSGHVSGISFVLDGEQMKGSDLGKGYTWKGLQRRGVSYEQNRDFESIGRAKEQREALEAGRKDGSLEHYRIKEGRGIDRQDGSLSGDDGQSHGRLHSHHERGRGDSKENYRGQRFGDGESKMGGQGDRSTSRQNEPKDVDYNDSSRGSERSTRSKYLRALAAALRSTTSRGQPVEKFHSNLSEPERGQAAGIKKALRMGSEEIKGQQGQETPEKYPKQKKGPWTDPFSLDPKKRKKLEREPGRGRGGPDIGF